MAISRQRMSKINKAFNKQAKVNSSLNFSQQKKKRKTKSKRKAPSQAIVMKRQAWISRFMFLLRKYSSTWGATTTPSTSYSYVASSPAMPNGNLFGLQSRDDTSQHGFVWEKATGKLFKLNNSGSVSVSGSKYVFYWFAGGYVGSYGTLMCDDVTSYPNSLGNYYDDWSYTTSSTLIISKD